MSVVNISKSKTLSCKNWTENGQILVWTSDWVFVYCWCRMESTTLMSFKCCKLWTSFTSNLHGMCGMMWYRTSRIKVLSYMIDEMREGFILCLCVAKPSVRLLNMDVVCSGTPINKGPCIGNKDLNLYRLFRVVQNIGGYNKVCALTLLFVSFKVSFPL